MRTEIDSIPAIATSADVSVVNADSTSPDARQLLDAGIRAAQAGDRTEARTALLNCTELDPGLESAWMWLASLSEIPEELLEYLQRVLEINPENARALEWRAATDSLLSKTYVQRGADAAETGDKESATEFFVRALEHDKRNAVAWMWLATLSESNEGKLLYIEKALAIDPDFEDAVTAYSSTRNEISGAKLAAAKTAIVENRVADANVLLNLVLSNDAASTEALWLRCIFAESFVEKLDAFERLADVAPQETASNALEILKTLSAQFEVAVAAPAEVPEAATGSDNLSMAISEVVRLEPAAEPERIPTEELEMPEGVEAAFEAEAEADRPYEEPTAFVVENIEVPESVEPPYEAAVIEQSEPEENANVFVSDLSEVATIDEVQMVPEVEAYEEVSEIQTPAVSDPADFPDVEAAYQLAYFEEPEPVVDADPFPTMYAADIAEFESGNGIPEYAVAEPVMPATNNVYSFESFAPSATDDGDIVAESYASAPAEPEFEDAIPMPDVDLDLEDTLTPDPYATQIVAPEPEAPSVSLCAFCSSPHEPTSVVCYGCKAVLSLTDIEFLISNTDADRELLQSVAEGLELEGRYRELSVDELKTIGLAHLNLRNLDAGYSALLRASELDATDAVLANQVNSLHIRIEEVKAQEAAHEAMPKGKTVLVVDDSPTILKLISSKLEKSGHQVFCSASGEEAMEWLVDMVPDLVLLDINLPQMDGYQVCKLIRAADATKDVPVVMISGKEGFFDKVRGKMAGVSGHITKPFGPETLMKTVDGFLKGQAAPAE